MVRCPARCPAQDCPGSCRARCHHPHPACIRWHPACRCPLPPAHPLSWRSCRAHRQDLLPASRAGRIGVNCSTDRSPTASASALPTTTLRMRLRRPWLARMPTAARSVAPSRAPCTSGSGRSRSGPHRTARRSPRSIPSRSASSRPRRLSRRRQHLLVAARACGTDPCRTRGPGPRVGHEGTSLGEVAQPRAAYCDVSWQSGAGTRPWPVWMAENVTASPVTPRHRPCLLRFLAPWRPYFERLYLYEGVEGSGLFPRFRRTPGRRRSVGDRRPSRAHRAS